LRILTIAETFPSLIQPWLVNNLVQIQKNGGENRIIAGRSELKVYSEAIDRYGLKEVYDVVPTSRLALVGSAVGNLLSRSSLRRTPRGCKRLLGLAFNRHLSAKERLLATLILPHLGMSDVDVVHSHSEHDGRRLRPLIFALDRPMVVTFHGLPPKGVKKLTPEERTAYLDCAQVILVNTQFAKRHYVSLGAPEHKIRIIPQGTDLSEYAFKPASYPQDRSLRLLTVGRMSADKGQRYAIDAVAELARTGTNIRYTLVGSGLDADALKQHVRDLGLSGIVEFHSNVTNEELRKFYAESDVFLLPSVRSQDGFHEETQGVVLQEAQASGLLTIATRTGGIPECIDDGRAGFLIDDRSAAAIAGAVRNLVDNPDKWPEWQESARAWVVDRYDTNIIGSKMYELYEELAYAHLRS